jgi:hypothetical protein
VAIQPFTCDGRTADTNTYGMTADELAALERALCIAELVADPADAPAAYRLRHCRR